MTKLMTCLSYSKIFTKYELNERIVIILGGYAGCPGGNCGGGGGGGNGGCNGDNCGKRDIFLHTQLVNVMNVFKRNK